MASCERPRSIVVCTDALGASRKSAMSSMVVPQADERGTVFIRLRHHKEMPKAKTTSHEEEPTNHVAKDGAAVEQGNRLARGPSRRPASGEHTRQPANQGGQADQKALEPPMYCTAESTSMPGKMTSPRPMNIASLPPVLAVLDDSAVGACRLGSGRPRN